ncbi:MAG TPA: hypothetical protein VK957_00825 [Lunatimonas sp.]|nr:hypothetical protein [Lunatimonas sp.]
MSRDRENLIHRPPASATDDQEYTSKEHAPICSGAMHHFPKSILLKNFSFGTSNGNDHNKQGRDGCQSGHQSHYNKDS